MNIPFWLKRHPLPVSAYFAHSLVLTYALPAELLRPLLPPGLQLDTLRKGPEEFGFVAIALVQTQGLRPTFLPPFFGQDFFLSGYRIFARFTTARGTQLRGLRILRSDTDKRMLAIAGNCLTHYNYRLATVAFEVDESTRNIEVETFDGEADLMLRAKLSSMPAPLPPGSPFENIEEARHFAGPLPFTFDYEAETHSLIVIKGVRKKWNPQPVRVEVERCTFFDQPPFDQAQPIMSRAEISGESTRPLSGAFLFVVRTIISLIWLHEDLWKKVLVREEMGESSEPVSG